MAACEFVNMCSSKNSKKNKPVSECKRLQTNALGIEFEEIAAAIRSSGYVIDTLQAAIWAVQTTQSFEAAVLKAVNLGDDADTVGAVTGQIAGAMYGYSKVTKALKSGIFDERKLYVTSQLLCTPRINA